MSGSYTNEDYVPSFEELKVPELPISSSTLRTASLYMGKYCDEQCKEFMLCNEELKDPIRCLNEGKEVTRCGYEFLKKVRLNCREEFNNYHSCLDLHGGKSMHFRNCRDSQQPLDDCLFRTMNLERPESGYFVQRRFHSSTRPPPPDLRRKYERLPPMADLAEMPKEQKPYPCDC
ncbi:NADH dehydrogenase [ubiquinone] 1 alpha subcomplex subunit 8-like [Mizuhopecten yessoensis]|uniref:NADH dehydrogenase [ubiquinone] 1 alpha subcomplex subunit 8 n=1 Tax=Mizuhopecten yessoensis TaxID=6573 RepID=A0A210QMI4_MIZYE|nr:NADH dehydrogenase [ubiquinone] 1 alpha subcomplex subunit 8-like [Mizuhopecten yessoensis]OWF49943.1 NADH dehydrogenase [ubiquinone] 1 alpha subcomplex subunit 8 [Mizuhopecten yessoensis]